MRNSLNMVDWQTVRQRMINLDILLTLAMGNKRTHVRQILGHSRSVRWSPSVVSNIFEFWIRLHPESIHHLRKRFEKKPIIFDMLNISCRYLSSAAMENGAMARCHVRNCLLEMAVPHNQTVLGLTKDPFTCVWWSWWLLGLRRIKLSHRTVATSTTGTDSCRKYLCTTVGGLLVYWQTQVRSFGAELISEATCVLFKFPNT